MEKEEEDNHMASQPPHFAALDFSRDHHIPNPRTGHEGWERSVEMVDYMPSNPPPLPQPQTSLDKLSFADVMQLADFGPKLSLNPSRTSVDDDDDSNYFLRYRLEDPPPPFVGINTSFSAEADVEGSKGDEGEGEDFRFSENPCLGQFEFTAAATTAINGETKKRKRSRSTKTSEEVESQRMTHIAVERNRRRQMNEHLRVLKSLMPGSYVQRGDQASVIGGAIEFVRELEQLLQCLESQKRRRIFGATAETARGVTEAPPPPIHQPFAKLLEVEPELGLREEAAESKSLIADVEVKLLGFDATIKILSRRRPGQLLKTIAALEDLGFNILHTNITTIDQTVLYSFNVKINGETICTAEDVANSVQQILGFIDASTL